ncbi:MAG: beta-mannanase [Alphaproteobacteria bacterium]|nr:beta-mannanase [Alphaproteobacteria bacterium]
MIRSGERSVTPETSQQSPPSRVSDARANEKQDVKRPIHSNRRPIRASAFLALLAIAFCCLPSATALAKGKPARPLYWGAVMGSQLTGTAAPWDVGAIDKFEQLAGKRASIVAFSSPFADCIVSPCSFFPFPSAGMETLRQRGTIPFLTWASQSVPSSLDEPSFQLSDVVNGDYDAYIREFAKAAREWGHPFFLRLDPEMNGFWFPWSEGVNGNLPGQFIAAWRHVHDVFASVGATNATWVWCPNIDFNHKLTPLKSLYPGKEYVDWTCLDGFNWGATANSVGWQNFNQIFHSTLHRMIKIAPEKPVMIGEVASDDRGGSKAGWIREMLRIVPSHYRKVRGLIWYDEKDQGMHWPIESSHAATRAFAKGISRSVFRPNVFSQIGTTPIPPPQQ